MEHDDAWFLAQLKLLHKFGALPHKLDDLLSSDLVQTELVRARSPRIAIQRVVRQAVDQSNHELGPALRIVLDLQDGDTTVRSVTDRYADAHRQFPRLGPTSVALQRRVTRTDVAEPVLNLIADQLAAMEHESAQRERLKVIRVTWKDFGKMAEKLANTVRQYQPEVVVGVGRGGLALAIPISHELRTPHFGAVMMARYTAEGKVEPTLLSAWLPEAAAATVLIVDEVASEGRTLEAVAGEVRAKYGTDVAIAYAVAYRDIALFDSPIGKRLRAFHDAETFRAAKQWIEFPWEPKRDDYVR